MAEKNIKKVLEDYKEETNRHFDVVAENLKGEIKQVAEEVSLNTERIENVQKDVNTIKGDMGVMKVDIETIKIDIEFIKNELKRKLIEMNLLS